MKQKWINEGGIFFPISGDTVIHETPGPGIFKVTQSPNPMDARLGLVKVCNKFEFNFKIYKLGAESISEKIKTVWNSDLFVNSNRSLGVIFNGLKGTGKTISAKLLCNDMNIPVVIVDQCFENIVDFIQNLCFDCVVFIDEAEKIFGVNKDGQQGHILLKLVDGVYSNSRKLYLLTTNQLNVNENLLGRPGRIRYIHEFKNLPKEAVQAYVNDNLIDKSKAPAVYTQVDQLTISTIDILKSIVDEVNMLGELGDPCELNIPKAKYVYDVLRFYNVAPEDKNKIEEILNKLITNKETNLYTWLTNVTEVDVNMDFDDIVKSETEEDNKVISGSDDDAPKKEETEIRNISNRDILRHFLSKELNKTVSDDLETMTADTSFLYEGLSTSLGNIMKGTFNPKDRFQIFTMSSRWEEEDDYVCLLVRQRNNPSLYRGDLII